MILKLKKYRFHQNKLYNINKIVVSDRLPFGKKDFRYFIGYKDDKQIRPLCIYFPKVSAYRIDFGETECMYFMIKEEKVFDKYMEIWEKVNNIIKEFFNSELIYSKKYLITKKAFNTKESFQCFYRGVIPVPVVLIV